MGRKWLLAHRWAGLALGLFLAVQGLLGAWLVIADPLDEWLHPQLLRSDPTGNAEPIGLASAYRRVVKAYPNRHLWLLMSPREHDGVYRAILDGEHGPRIYVDAYSGTILGKRAAFTTLETPVRVLHMGAVGGPWLETFGGVLAIVLLVLGGTGIVVWWPGWNSLRRALGFSTATLANLLRDLHRWAGLLGVILITPIALSATYLIFHHAIQSTVNAISGEQKFPPPLQLADDSTLPPDPNVAAAVAKAREAIPKARITLLGFPSQPAHPLQVRLRYPGEWHPIGNSTVLLHPESNQVLATYDLKEAGPGHYTLDHLYPLHIGIYGGTATRALHFVGGLLPMLFFATGATLWWRRRRSRRRRFRHPAPRG